MLRVLLNHKAADFSPPAVVLSLGVPKSRVAFDRSSSLHIPMEVIVDVSSIADFDEEEGAKLQRGVFQVLVPCEDMVSPMEARQAMMSLIYSGTRRGHAGPVRCCLACCGRDPELPSPLEIDQWDVQHKKSPAGETECRMHALQILLYGAAAEVGADGVPRFCQPERADADRHDDRRLKPLHPNDDPHAMRGPG